MRLQCKSNAELMTIDVCIRDCVNVCIQEILDGWFGLLNKMSSADDGDEQQQQQQQPPRQGSPCLQALLLLMWAISDSKTLLDKEREVRHMEPRARRLSKQARACVCECALVVFFTGPRPNFAAVGRLVVAGTPGRMDPRHGGLDRAARCGWARSVLVAVAIIVIVIVGVGVGVGVAVLAAYFARAEAGQPGSAEALGEAE